MHTSIWQVVTQLLFMRQPTCKVENEKIPFPMTVDFATPCLTDEPNSAVLVLRVPSKVDSEVVSPEFEFLEQRHLYSG